MAFILKSGIKKKKIKEAPTPEKRDPSAATVDYWRSTIDCRGWNPLLMQSHANTVLECAGVSATDRKRLTAPPTSLQPLTAALGDSLKHWLHLNDAYVHSDSWEACGQIQAVYQAHQMPLGLRRFQMWHYLKLHWSLTFPLIFCLFFSPVLQWFLNRGLFF